MTKLTEQQISEGLKAVKGWKRTGDAITKTVKKKDFVHAMGFVQGVAFAAEKMNHHPDIVIRWNTVTLTLTTHSMGGLTALDLECAKNINRI
jgi:4a-hydroxytetrahydrobiopterin dehydratase